MEHEISQTWFSIAFRSIMSKIYLIILMAITGNRIWISKEAAELVFNSKVYQSYPIVLAHFLSEATLILSFQLVHSKEYSVFNSSWSSLEFSFYAPIPKHFLWT